MFICGRKFCILRGINCNEYGGWSLIFLEDLSFNSVTFIVFYESMDDRGLPEPRAQDSISPISKLKIYYIIHMYINVILNIL